MPMICAPRCFLASGCESSCVTHLCIAATMSQVTVTGGDSATCGDLPTLISCTGAGAPHAP